MASTDVPGESLPAEDGPVNELKPWVTALVEWNSRRVQKVDAGHPNPRQVDSEQWYRDLVAAHPRIRAEWDAFIAAGGELPLIEDILGFRDQNQGSYWKMGPFINLCRPVDAVREVFPETIAAFMAVPGMRSASWSVLGPGGWIPEHVGPNAGCLRLLVGVDADAASIRVGSTEAHFSNGEGTLFEDTVPHSVENPGTEPRVVVLCDLIRPVHGLTSVHNRVVQRALHSMTPAYRDAARRASERFTQLNPGVGSG